MLHLLAHVVHQLLDALGLGLRRLPFARARLALLLLTRETLLLFLPALGYLLYLEWIGTAAFGHTAAITAVLLVCSGVATALPLLLFAAAARRITLTSLGILQYIAPTLQFLLGVLVYHEPLSRARLIGFCLVWLALGLYTLEGMLRGGREAQFQPAIGEP